MRTKDYSMAVQRIREKQAIYDEQAYYFLKDGLDYTLQSLRQQKVSLNGNHVSGPQLLQGIRSFALDQFGPLTLTVLDHWNIRSTRDFGVMVFQLIEEGVLGKTAEDSLTDFENQFEFEEAFSAPFRPGQQGDTPSRPHSSDDY